MIGQSSNEGAAKLLERSLRYIKKTIQKKIGIYEPLEYNSTYTAFLSWLQANDLKLIREIPDGIDGETYLEGLIKNYLIESAYYALEERYIRRRVMNKMGISDPNHIRVMEMVDFIIERIEREKFKKLKQFQEKSKFKTYLTIIVTRLWADYWRDEGKKENNVSKYPQDFDALFDAVAEEPYETLAKNHQDNRERIASIVLPNVLTRLPDEEKLVLKLKYKLGTKISGIARTLGMTRYKAEIFISEIEDKISKQILAEISKTGGNHGAP